MSRLEKQEIVTNKTRYCLDEQLRQAILLLEPLWDEKSWIWTLIWKLPGIMEMPT